MVKAKDKAVCPDLRVVSGGLSSFGISLFESTTTMDLNKLPPEIVSQIFIYCLPRSPVGYNPADFPLLFTSICRVWKDIAFSTPELWSSLYIYLQPEQLLSDLTRANRWLSRSGDRPLTINYVVENTSYIPMFGFGSPAALENMTRYCHRWQHVSLSLPLPYFQVLDVIRGRVPLLKTLVLDPQLVMLPHHIRWNDFSDTIHAFDVSPLLTDITLKEATLSLVQGIAWDQIKVFRGIGNKLDDLLDMLVKSHRLTSVVIEDPYFERHSSLLTFTINTSLLSLTLTVDTLISMDAFHELLKYVTLPALTKLHLVGAYPAWPHQLFKNFLSRSGCPLRWLSLPSSSGETVQIFELLPTLLHLELRPCVVSECNPVFCDYLLAALISDPNSRNLLPKLKTLKLRSYHFTDDTGRLLLEMLSSKWKQENRALDTFEFISVSYKSDSVHSVDSAQLRYLQELKKEGLDVHINAQGHTWL